MLRAGVIDLNLTIKNGEFVVLTGCSGCGKTTVCRLINGLIPHYFDGEKTGDIFLDGKDVSKQPIYETARTVGSVLEEGEIIFAVKKASGSSRYEKIVTMMPITVLSAIREARDHDIAVKGGKFLEAVAEADTIVFDKTGTLTKAKPTLKMVVPFCDRSEDDLLRLAACLEEHFPHSMAKAVVRAAKKRGLDHEEMHSKVEYIVAHGISSYVGENKVIIGSYHFVFDDEKCIIPQGYEERFAELPREYSHIFMAVNGVLSAVICIEDPLRPESADVVCALRAVGFKKIVMMTGDSKRTAQAVADAGIAISLQSMQDLLKEN